jgi:hypothetical protein
MDGIYTWRNPIKLLKLFSPQTFLPSFARSLTRLLVDGWKEG